MILEWGSYLKYEYYVKMIFDFPIHIIFLLILFTNTNLEIDKLES